MIKFITILSLVLSLNLFASKTAPKTLQIDTSKSSVKWTGYAPGKSHWGTVKLKEGSIQVSGVHLKGGTATIDMTSIDCKDLDGKDGDPKIEGHLKNADFFDVGNKEKKGHISLLKVKDVKMEKGGKYELTADFTILAQTHPITIAGVDFVRQENGTFKATGKAVLNRVTYGIKYKSKSVVKNVKDGFIKDNIDLEITLVTKK